jgi:hypothetical protein
MINLTSTDIRLSGTYTVSIATAERWKFCPSCGTKLGAEWSNYCAECGKPIGQIAAPITVQPSYPQPPTIGPWAPPYGPNWCGSSTYVSRGDEQCTYTS